MVKIKIFSFEKSIFEKKKFLLKNRWNFKLVTLLTLTTQIYSKIFYEQTHLQKICERKKCIVLQDLPIIDSSFTKKINTNERIMIKPAYFSRESTTDPLFYDVVIQNISNNYYSYTCQVPIQ